jgi:hypothetical protein
MRASGIRAAVIHRDFVADPSEVLVGLVLLATAQSRKAAHAAFL